MIYENLEKKNREGLCSRGWLIFLMFVILLPLSSFSSSESIIGRTFYIDSANGDDSFDGNSTDQAWKSLKPAEEIMLLPGDSLLLRRGSHFSGTLKLKIVGSKQNPVVVDNYGTGNKDDLPVIDASGFLAAVEILNGKHFIIKNLELTADGGPVKAENAKTKRFGVLVVADSSGVYPGIHLENLKIQDVFASESVKHIGQNPTSNLGMGIAVLMEKEDARIKDVTIRDCLIERTGFTGIRIFGYGNRLVNSFLEHVSITNNTLKNIGGPGMVPGRCRNVKVEGNVVDHSGSSADPRMHNRGSGIWPWSCTDVIIQKNKFMHARGKNDSCGAHIDFNCKNVIIQYNLSYDNEGGFVEILGNNHNCVYRYNLSINDGSRVKGENEAQLDGRLLWFSGFVGRENEPTGPFNSYVYNNTIYVDKYIQPNLFFSKTAEGILISNNIFYTENKMVEVGLDQGKWQYQGDKTLSNVFINNNLFLQTNTIPESLNQFETCSIIGDPHFKNPGGQMAGDYIPANKDLVKDKGIRLQQLPSDTATVFYDLEVKSDFFDNPISGNPDLGAIEIK